MSLSAWFLGSITIPAQTLTVDATGFSFPDGNYYLRHATDAMSIIATLAARVVANVGGTCTVVIRRDRRIIITFNTARTVTWGAATQIRDLLGYTGNLAIAATTFTATNISPLLWSPGYLATPATIEGVTGYTMPHQAIRKSSDGTQVQCDHYGEETWQELGWTHILPARLRTDGTTAAQGGTFHQFYQQCAMLRRRFLYHQEIDEDDASTTAVTYDTALGPYVLRPEFDGNWYRRNVPYAEVSSPLDLPIHLVAEYA